MKIEETKAGNIKIVMNKREAKALFTLLENLDYFNNYVKDGESLDIVNLWSELGSHKHLYD